MLVSTAAVVPQASAQSTAAHVYIQVQGPAGAVYGYSASSSGQLTAIPGSPFKPGTAMIGSNNSQFFTLGKTTLHSFAVGSNGAIGSQLSTAAIFDYAGNSCGGGINGSDYAVLDHTGKDIYVLLQSGPGNCAAYQSYIVNSNGSFTFNGDAEEDTSDGAYLGLPSILGNESFAYANQGVGHYSGDVGFQRQSTGTLQFMQFKETDPAQPETDYLPSNPDASPTGNYVVLQLVPSDGGGGDGSDPQLGSYTVDSQGNLTTTNTSSNMPTSQLMGGFSTFSPDGTMFVLYTGGPSSGTSYGDGIEIYNFNGASPLTLNTTLLTGTPISQMAWDTSHHLYAISQFENKLWVFNVTGSSVTQADAISIGTPFSMVVTSLAATTGGGGGACTAPSSAGVNVCSPGESATVTSPVQINAAATVSGGVYRFELWNGSTKLLSVDNGIMDQSLSLAPGSYHLTFDARSSSGSHEYATRDITVQ
jgi:hypothetical protein